MTYTPAERLGFSMSSEKEIKIKSVKLNNVWCFDCQGKQPMKITLATALIPARSNHYDLNKKLIGICSECLAKREKFYQKNTQPVDCNNPNLLYRPI